MDAANNKKKLINSSVEALCKSSIIFSKLYYISYDCKIEATPPLSHSSHSYSLFLQLTNPRFPLQIIDNTKTVLISTLHCQPYHPVERQKTVINASQKVADPTPTGRRSHCLHWLFSCSSAPRRGLHMVDSSQQ